MQRQWSLHYRNNNVFQVMSNLLRRLRRNQDQVVIIDDDVDDVDDEHNARDTQAENTPVILEDDDALEPTQSHDAIAAAAVSPAAAAVHKAEASAPAKQQSSAAASPVHAAPEDTAATADPDAGSTCTICLELLFEQGSHRPAALKCGHIFGDDCIREWLRHKPRCPQCNHKARARDITLLYNLPKAVAAGAGDADLQAKLREVEESSKRERDRAAQLEAQLRDMQRQLALKQQQQPPVARQFTFGVPGAAAAHSTGRAWQHQLPYPQTQQQPHTLHQQQQLYQQHSTAGLYGDLGLAYQQQQQQPPGHGHLPQQNVVGQKRSWAQASSPAEGAQQPLPSPPLSSHEQQQEPAQVQPAAAATMGDITVGPAAAPAMCKKSGGGPQLMLVSVRRPIAATDSGMHLQQRRIAGAFVEMQQYNLENSRCFHLDVPSALLMVGERPNVNSTRLRKVCRAEVLDIVHSVGEDQLVVPWLPSYLTLPSTAGVVRGLAAQQSSGFGSGSGSNLLAVATEKAGVQLVSIGTNNVVQKVLVQSPVWSVAWSPQHEHQLLMGLDKGRMAVADLRKPSGDMLLSLCSSSTADGGTNTGKIGQPLHSLIALQDWQFDQLMAAQQDGLSSSSSKWSGAKPEAIVACTGGVYSWSRSCPDTFNLLLPSSCHGGTCESISLAPDGSTVAASFRAPLSQTAAAAGPAGISGGAPVHLVAKLGILQPGDKAAVVAASATQDAVAAAPLEAAAPWQTQAATATTAADMGIAAALQAGRERLLQETLLLSGHSSRTVMTHGCFLGHLPGLHEEQLVFASADEATCTPRLWGCSTGCELLPARPWVAMQSPVLQVAGGVSSGWGAMLGAMTERGMLLYQWRQNADM